MNTSNAGGLAFGHGKLWVIHGTTNWASLAQYNPDSFAEIGQITMHDLPGLIVSANEGIFVSGAIGGKKPFLSKFDSQTGEELARLILPHDVLALGKTEKYIIAAGLNGKIWIISQDDMTIERAIETGSGEFELRAVFPVGDTLYVTTYNDNEKIGFMLAFQDWQP